MSWRLCDDVSDAGAVVDSVQLFPDPPVIGCVFCASQLAALARHMQLHCIQLGSGRQPLLLGFFIMAHHTLCSISVLWMLGMGSGEEAAPAARIVMTRHTRAGTLMPHGHRAQTPPPPHLNMPQPTPSMHIMHTSLLQPSAFIVYKTCSIAVYTHIHIHTQSHMHEDVVTHIHIWRVYWYHMHKLTPLLQPATLLPEALQV